MERCAAGSVPTVTNGKKKTQNNQFIAYLMVSACAAFSAASAETISVLASGSV